MKNIGIQRQTRHKAIEKLRKFILECENNPDELWDIPLTNGAQTEGYRASAYTRKVYERVGLTTFSSKLHADIPSVLLSLEEMMIEHKVLLSGYSGAELDGRRKLKQWWMGLSTEDKKNLTCSGDNIQFGKYVNFRSLGRHKLVREFCENCNEELRELGVFNSIPNVYVQIRLQTIEKLSEFILGCKNNPDRLWDIPLTNGAQTEGYGASAFTQKVYERVGLTTYTQTRIAHVDIQNALLPLEEMMIEHKVLLSGYSGAELDGRRKFKQWWMGLSTEDKKNLTCFGDSIQFKKHVSFHQLARYKIVREFCENCNEELRELGVLNSDYVPVKDRLTPLNSDYKNVVSLNRLKWKFLSELTLESEDDLIKISDDNEPYVQLRHLFGAQKSTVLSETGQSNYEQAFTHLSNYLRLEYIPENTELKDILNEYLLLKFKKTISLINWN
jgi:hypothetical protein